MKGEIKGGNFSLWNSQQRDTHSGINQPKKNRSTKGTYSGQRDKGLITFIFFRYI